MRLRPAIVACPRPGDRLSQNASGPIVVVAFSSVAARLVQSASSELTNQERRASVPREPHGGLYATWQPRYLPEQRVIIADSSYKEGLSSKTYSGGFGNSQPNSTRPSGLPRSHHGCWQARRECPTRPARLILQVVSEPLSPNIALANYRPIHDCLADRLEPSGPRAHSVSRP